MRQIVIPGSLRKKEWVGVGDILLVSLRIGMTDDKVGDLMAKLYPEEIQTLKQKGDISEAWQAGGAGEGEGEGGGFVFSDGVEEGDDDEEEEVNVRSAVRGVEDAGLLRGAPRPTARALSLLHTPNAHLSSPHPRPLAPCRWRTCKVGGRRLLRFCGRRHNTTGYTLPSPSPLSPTTIASLQHACI